MDRLLIPIVVYGYVLPLAVSLAWMAWQFRSDLKAGGKYRACWSAKDLLPVLIPGVSLCMATLLLTLLLDWILIAVRRMLTGKEDRIWM